jgi:diacylglycerol kinase family enzyme
VFLVLGSEVAVIVAEARENLLWAVWASAALVVLAFVAGRTALAQEGAAQPYERGLPPPRHPFLIMNPRSGGGKAERFGLREKAERLGVEVAVLEGPEHVDVAELARKAIGSGADLVGVAGGDGTQALVAAVAAAEDVPMFVVPAGTRNHFALDLGLDRNDLGASLDALTNGVEMRVDLGDVNGRPFVNNVSFGGYAAIVERPDYRDDKLRVTARVLPDLLSGREGAHLTARVDGRTISEPQALLVSNNAYGTGDVAGLGRRVRLDQGELGVVAIRVSNAWQATRLLWGTRSRGITRLVAHEVVVEADTPEIPAGIDGESVIVPAPVRCQVRPRALRVRLPRERPGGAQIRPPVRIHDLVGLALHSSRHAAAAS